MCVTATYTGLLSPAASRHSTEQFRMSVHVCIRICVCNIPAYGYGHNNSENAGAISSNFLWALFVLLVTMSLHLGSVARSLAAVDPYCSSSLNVFAERFSELMTRALIEDKVDFVRLFLQSGIDIRKFLTRDKLQQLYQSVREISCCLCS